MLSSSKTEPYLYLLGCLIVMLSSSTTKPSPDYLHMKLRWKGYSQVVLLSCCPLQVLSQVSLFKYYFSSCKSLFFLFLFICVCFMLIQIVVFYKTFVILLILFFVIVISKYFCKIIHILYQPIPNTRINHAN